MAATSNDEQMTQQSDAENQPSDEALRLLEDPDLLDRAAHLMDDLGLCGEELNRRMVFLAGVGGVLSEPIHLIVKGGSSGGKNTLVNKAISLLPEDQVHRITHMSAKWLSRAPSPLTGVLVIVEAEGQESAEYALRAAMSEGEVTNYTLVPTGDGGWESEEQHVKVAASIITTTTEPALHPENQTRVFDLSVDESEQQTREVLTLLADRAASGGPPADLEARLELWHEALSLLEPLGVSVPFARELAEALPARQLRMRRDFGRVLSLIRISTLLHQRQRLRLPDGRVIAELADYKIAYHLLQEVLEPSLQGLTPTALALCELHDELARAAGDEWVKRKDLEKEAGRRDIASPNTVHDWCKQLTKLGYWQGEVRGRFGAWYHRKIRDPNEEPVALPGPEELDRPDLPRGPNSLVGRRSARSDRASEAPPNPHTSEDPGSDGADATEIHLSGETDWEASEKPQHEGEKSSQPLDWEGVDPDDDGGSHTARVSTDLADHGVGSYEGS